MTVRSNAAIVEDEQDEELEEGERGLEGSEPAPAAPPPAVAKPEKPAPFRLVNNADIRRRRQVLAAGLEAAREELRKAEERWQAHVRRMADQPAERKPFEAITQTGILNDELDQARAEVAAQEGALRLLDEQLSFFETPERREAAAKARQRFKAALEKHYQVIDRLEKVVKGDLIASLADVFASRKRAAAELGAETFGPLGEMTGDSGLKHRLSLLMGSAMHRLIDASALAFNAGNGIKDDRPWRDHEAKDLNVEALE